MRNGAKHATGRQTHKERVTEREDASPGKVIINRFVVVFKLNLFRMGIALQFEVNWRWKIVIIKNKDVSIITITW